MRRPAGSPRSSTRPGTPPSGAPPWVGRCARRRDRRQRSGRQAAVEPARASLSRSRVGCRLADGAPRVCPCLPAAVPMDATLEPEDARRGGDACLPHACRPCVDALEPAARVVVERATPRPQGLSVESERWSKARGTPTPDLLRATEMPLAPKAGAGKIASNSSEMDEWEPRLGTGALPVPNDAANACNSWVSSSPCRVSQPRTPASFQPADPPVPHSSHARGRRFETRRAHWTVQAPT